MIVMLDCYLVGLATILKLSTKLLNYWEIALAIYPNMCSWYSGPLHSTDYTCRVGVATPPTQHTTHVT